MLSCTDFCDRLYDEDCRHALAGRGPLPPDVSMHRQECAGCRLAWAEAAEDLATLPHLLMEPAPPALLADLRVAVIKGLELPPTFDWTAGITWAAIGRHREARSPETTKSSMPLSETGRQKSKIASSLSV